MPQQLWLLRHGDAEPHDARPDAERRLTERGERQSDAAGRALARLHVDFTVCFSSPRVRALDTARRACAPLSLEPLVRDVLGGGCDADDALELAAAEGPDARVLLVGHNPGLPGIVAQLTGARVDLKKGGVAGVRLDGRRGELVTLLRPRELAAVGCGADGTPAGD